MFINDTKAVEPDPDYIRHGMYGYDRPCTYLLIWGRLLQRVVSQVGTKLLTGTYHTQDTGILKSEGGVNLVGVGELVLLSQSCHLDLSSMNKIERQNVADKMATIITKIVLGWDPMLPAESMVRLGAAVGGFDELELLPIINESKGGGPFGGNPLDSFFDRTHNSFDRDAMWHELRPYRRYTMTYNGAKTEAEADQIFADEDLGKQLLEKLNAKLGDRHGMWSRFFACTPNRSNEGVSFWVNGSGNLGLKAGHYTQEQIEAWLRA